jgi:uncharacterized membrane protein
MVALFVATVAGAVMLYPRSGESPEKLEPLAEGVHYEYGTVTKVRQASMEGADGEVRLHLDDRDGDVPIQLLPEVPASEFSLGDRVKVVFYPAAAQSGSPYVFADFVRGPPLALLAGLFVLVVIAVARLKGIAALAGLVGSLAVVWFFLVPALAAGKNPLALALVTAGAVMFIVVYLTHGISAKTTAALLGTYAGIAIVVGLAAWMIPAAHLIPATTEEVRQLAGYMPHLDVRGVLLCGMVLAGVGVLNDVTITQASAVWELRAAAPAASRRAVFARGMRIGRDHIASTVYTIAFAYVGTALVLLLMAQLFKHSFLDVLAFEEIGEEIVRTLVASIGLVLAIPLTTLIAAWLAPRPAAAPGESGAPGMPSEPGASREPSAPGEPLVEIPGSGADA